MKIKFFIVFFLCVTMVFSQKEKSTNVGNIHVSELKMDLYKKDSTASALVLYEHANLYVNDQKKYDFTTDYYHKIKIFTKKGFAKSIISIQLYDKEKITGIKAITYNLKNETIIESVRLDKKEIFTKQLNGKWREVTFTLPNIKEGSVIEYKYSITSPYSKIDDWYFQSDIPKLKSDFTASILGNWKYNISLRGFLKLNRNTSSIKNNCVYNPNDIGGDCLVFEFGIDNIPAFEEEDYMLSKKNFISRVVFELQSFTDINGNVKKYTKSWKSADNTLKNDFLDNQTSKKNFFKKRVLNDAILNIKDPLIKAKTVFSFIKNHFTWDGNYWPKIKVRVKEAYANKKGNVFDINLSLYNALQAAKIPSKLVLLSTRNNGLPTRLHPVTSDFNFLVVKATIHSKIYYLDATKKNMPFGLIQFNALNGEGRVMDFKKGSFWQQLKLSQKTSKSTRLNLEFVDNSFVGKITINRSGYSALNRRDKISGATQDDIIDDFETQYPSIEVEEYQNINLKKTNEKLLETFKVVIETDLQSQKRIKINPFLIDKISQNPFKLNKRDYPVDYGYPRSNTYLLKLKIPENYSVKKLPEKKSLSLPNKGGRFIFNIKQQKNTVNIYLRTTINKKSFSSEEYFYLKEFYNQIIKIQDNYIEIEKND